jgi:hypothetical protein
MLTLIALLTALDLVLMIAALIRFRRARLIPA